MEQRPGGEDVSRLDVWEERARQRHNLGRGQEVGFGGGSVPGLFRAGQGGQCSRVGVAERAGEDEAEEARRPTVQSHCEDLGLSEMGSPVGGSGAEG